MNEKHACHARDLLTRPEGTVASIAELLGISRVFVTQGSVPCL
ncbi:hypothetical protein [Streptomyces blastmyceticus]